MEVRGRNRDEALNGALHMLWLGVTVGQYASIPAQLAGVRRGVDAARKELRHRLHAGIDAKVLEVLGIDQQQVDY